MQITLTSDANSTDFEVRVDVRWREVLEVELVRNSNDRFLLLSISEGKTRQWRQLSHRRLATSYTNALYTHIHVVIHIA